VLQRQLPDRRTVGRDLDDRPNRIADRPRVALSCKGDDAGRRRRRRRLVSRRSWGRGGRADDGLTAREQRDRRPRDDRDGRNG